MGQMYKSHVPVCNDVSLLAYFWLVKYWILIGETLVNKNPVAMQRMLTAICNFVK